MIIKQAEEIKPSDITPESVYFDRRRFIKAGLAMGIAGSTGLLIPETAEAKLELGKIKKSKYALDDDLTPYDAVTSYNNFYEFGTDKSDPKKNSGKFKPSPWSVVIAGECDMPCVIGLEDLISSNQLEERIYRLRCVEAWSMVIPWVGVPLADVLKRFQPNSRAKYVKFTTVLRPKQMPGQYRTAGISWPYEEALRIDEAMHPLTLLSVGLYGQELPNQNGAPVRLVVPWKYGFKSIKSIVKIEFTENKPRTSWNDLLPREYGFYANVNPDVSHPRWAQNKERRIGELFKRKTLMFNGYADQVGSLYSNFDLAKNY